MHSWNRWLVVGPLLLAQLPVGCGKRIVRDEEQRLEVVSRPPGALIKVAHESGVRTLGRAPVELTVPYGVTEQLSPDGECAANSAGAAMAASSELLEIAEPDDEDEAAGWLIGALLAGILVGAATGASCPDRREVVAVHPTPVKFTAALKGYRTRELVVDVPLESGQVALELEPEGEAAPAPASRASAPDRRPVAERLAGSTVVVQEIDPAEGGLTNEVVGALNARLRDLVAAELAGRAVRRPGVHPTTGEPCVENACWTRLAETVSASHVLLTRLVATAEQECLLGASLEDLRDWVTVRAVAVRSGCAEAELMDAAEQLVEAMAE